MKKQRTRRQIATSFLALLAGCSVLPFHRGPEGGPADLVLRGGKVFVADSAFTTASALAVRGDRLVAVGDSADVERWIGPETRVVDLGGRLVTPGFNDAHLHFAAGGVASLDVVLQGTTSLDEIVRRVRTAAVGAIAGEWILGRGWDQTRLPPEDMGPGGWPVKEVLDRAAPDNPVFLTRVDGHSAWVNSRALELAGIDRTSPNPQGGEIVRDRNGEPTGILKENAKVMVERMLPPPSVEKLQRGIQASLDVARSSGLTSVQTSADPADLLVYDDLRQRGLLTVRVYAWIPLTFENIARYRADGVTAATGDAWLRRGIMKGYVDGSLGSRTAYMLEPFSDNPSTRGILRLGPPLLDSLVLAADQAGLQVALHAIGDAANRLALDAYEHAIVADGRHDARHRVEHAQILDTADIPRFAELGVIASMQPTHATSDMRWAEERIGRSRASEGGYAWRKLLDSGATVVFGTDYGVEPMAPVEGLYSAVTRQSREEPGTPPGGWLPSQKLSIEEAIRLYTATPAIAEFQEDEKGTLEAGKLADLVVWDRDLLTIEPAEILDAKPLMTMVGGRAVYEVEGWR